MLPSAYPDKEQFISVIPLLRRKQCKARPSPCPAINACDSSIPVLVSWAILVSGIVEAADELNSVMSGGDDSILIVWKNKSHIREANSERERERKKREGDSV